MLCWVRLPPAVLGLNVLSNGVETGPTATQFGPACAQNYASFARDMFTAGRAILSELWQADMIIIKQKRVLLFLN